MGVIVDIVPNHAAVGGHDNARWHEVLEWGRHSRHANLFDIDWDVVDPSLNGRVAVPFLGTPYDEALADGEFEREFDATRGCLHVDYLVQHFSPSHTFLGALVKREQRVG